MIGTKLGSYEIIGELGSGGMATVFRAHQPSMDRDVAIKVIHPRILKDAAARERFQREARLVARLEHPHVLPVYDFDGAHEPPYLVMRYLDGGTLKEMLSKRRVPFEEIAHLLRQIGSALDYAHRRGIIHRDIKPSNIMIDREANAFVTDYGIAKMAGFGEPDSGGMILGTPDYMSPEQAYSQHTDFRTDIYSLGVMLFEMTTGILPFQGNTLIETIKQHMEGRIPVPSSVNSELPPALDAVILRAMATNPAARFFSVDAFTDAAIKSLGGLTTSTPIQLRSAANSTLRLIDKPTARGGAPQSRTEAVVSGEQNRIVTAMVINAAEYVNLLESSEAETQTRLLSAFWEAAQQIIAEQGGTVFESNDGKLLALWGAEVVRENDAEQAVRAGLLISAQMQARITGLLPEGSPLPLKIGINTGFVLLRGRDGSVSGAPVTLADRITNLSEASVVITRDTFRHVQGIFDFHPTDSLKIKRASGHDQIELLRVVRAKPRKFRLEPRNVEGVSTRMIGRAHELKQLQNAFFNAQEDSETQMVTIISAAGLGKSRLLHEFATWADLRPEIFWIFRGRATPAMTQRPYALWKDILSFRFEILDSDPQSTVRQKLEAGTAHLMGEPDKRIAHMLGYLAGFNLGSGSSLGFNPTDIVGQAHRSLDAFIQRAAANSMVVFQLEDLHHADDASLDLLAQVAGAVPDRRVLIIGTARPLLYERRPTWGSGQDYHRLLDLQPLDRRDSRELVAEVLQKVERIPKDLRDLIVERAEGNPFYIEELIKMLVEDRIIKKVDVNTWTVEESRISYLRVPPTLIGLLQARFDSLLEPEKLTLQRAALAGRVFHDGALLAMDSVDDIHVSDLEEVLHQLIDREFIYQREKSAFAEHREFVFAQAMLRDQICETLLPAQVVVYNRAMAEWLSLQSGKRAGEYNAVIAEHYAQAGEPVLAADHLLLAGTKASELGAFAEAIGFLEGGLALLEENEHAAQQAALRLRLGEVYSLKGAFDDALTHLESALTGAREIGDQRAQATALAQLGRIAVWRGDRTTGRALLEEALPLAREVHDRATLSFILRQVGNLSIVADDHAAAQEALEESLRLAREIGDLDSAAAALNSLGIIATVKLDFTTALQYCEEALGMAREIGNRSAIAMFCANIAELQLERESYDAAFTAAEETLAVAQEIGSQVMIPGGLLQLGRVALYRGQIDTARSYFDQSLTIAHRIGHTRRLLDCLTAYALLRSQCGDLSGALDLLGLVQAHPSTDGDIRRKASSTLTHIASNMPDDDKQAALAHGASLTLDSVIEMLIQQKL